MLLNRAQAKLHLWFAVPTLIVTIFLLSIYIRESIAEGEWVGGGSGSGLLCGIAAGAVIVFEMLLWPRKAFRRLRLIPAKYWLAAHIWLGIASLPLAIAHCGFHLGGWLPTTFMLLFIACVASGLYGMAVQNVFPKWMLRNLPSETIYNQIDYVSDHVVEDLRQLLVSACGRKLSAEEILREDRELEGVKASAVVVGAIRQSGKTRGRTLQTRRFESATADRDPLWAAFEEVKPFLLAGRDVDTPVTDAQAASQWFGRLRSVCGKESESIIDIFVSMCDQRRQFDVQKTMHRWLHAWIPIHIGLAVAVTVLMAAHVWTALRYW